MLPTAGYDRFAAEIKDITGAKATLAVNGTALPATATVRLYQNGTTLTARTDSVSATGVAPGTWSVSKASLVLKAAQKGKRITVKVVAHRTGHQDGSAVSKATKVAAS
ncbi:hypothetical protein ACIQI8_34245 [Streptomyces sp. NPDC092369]|uniref:hypothetical protein n=1 Tax=Streptomyces sp. NPDC092369 TaxID=3366015 RepID=UPI00381E1124